MSIATLSSLVDKIKQDSNIYPICFFLQRETLASSMSKVEMVSIYHQIHARYSRSQIFVVIVVVLTKVISMLAI